jgi:hypothetical protein
MRNRSKLLIVGLTVLALTLGVWAAFALQAAKAPPPMGIPHVKVVPGAQKAFDAVSRISQTAARKDMYSCCLSKPCGFCAMYMAMCPCGKNLAAGKPVCRECKGGWEVGEGRIPGINAADVKGMSVDQVMRMMNSKMHRTKIKSK